MKLAFYKAAKGTFFSKAIAAYTRGPYSHCEIVFDEAYRSGVNPALIDKHDAGGSLCYSSSSWAPRHGCGFQDIDLTDGKWDVINVPGASQAKALNLAVADVGRKYDWPGLAGFIVPVIPDDRKKRFCSEECLLLLESMFLFRGHVASRVSPNQLAKIVGLL